MLKIRKAIKKDYPRIINILKDSDLYYQGLQQKDFWVAEKEGQIIGTLQLEEHKDFFFLGSLSVIKEEKGKGVAKELLTSTLKNIHKDIYLYTIIPDFFEKFGFTIVTPQPDLPSKDRYECEYCFSDKCVTMVRHPDVS